MKALGVVIAAGLALGACTNLQQRQAPQPGPAGTEFTRALAQQYRTFAADEWNNRADFSTSEWFAAKALRANGGEAALPEELGFWGPPAEAASDFAEARARLMLALESGARTRFPADAAITQRAFDCWLAHASTITAGGTPWSPYPPTSFSRQLGGQAVEPVQTHLKSCKDEFYEALARMPHGDPVLSVTAYFAPGRWDLDARGQASVREAVVVIRVRSMANVVVQGYADTAGSARANQILSERRANTLRRALLAEGVQASISTQAFGETRLAVPTPDNTPEQRNRRAVVVLF
jgi:outer membrane protein OmpA-like peptidoglycan-associated protein